MVNNFMIPIPLSNTDSLQTAAEPLLTAVLQHPSWAWACMRTGFNQRTKWGRLSMTTRRPRKTTSRNKCTCIRAIYMAQSGSNILCVSQCFLQSTYPPLLPVSAAWPHLHIFLAVCQPDLVVLGPYGLRYQENLAYCLVLKLSSLSQIYGFGWVIEKREMQALWVFLDAVQPPPPSPRLYGESHESRFVPILRTDQSIQQPLCLPGTVWQDLNYKPQGTVLLQGIREESCPGISVFLDRATKVYDLWLLLGIATSASNPMPFLYC